MKIRDMQEDISVFSIDEEMEYSFEDVKDLYKVIEQGLEESQPREYKQMQGSPDN